MSIGIIGAGAWGTALASVSAEAGHSVVLYARELEVVRTINEQHSNEAFLPGSRLPSSVTAVHNLNALASCDLLINATPTQFIRSTLHSTLDPSQFREGVPFVNVSKGIELGTHLRVSEIIHEVAPFLHPFATLSGPSHAEEVIQRMPTTVVCACEDDATAEFVQKALRTEAFRIYTSSDVAGVEICGALKNVIAIAAGIVDGAGLGDNTKAALMTRGLAEIGRLGVALGADVQTFYGLAGMGDLIVTCGSQHSRNRFVGEQIGKGRTLAEVLGNMTSVAEGVQTTNAALELAEYVNVELPITQKVHDILFENEDPLNAIRELMLRPAKAE